MTPDNNRSDLFDVSENSNTYPKPDKITIMTWPLDNIRGNSFKETISDTFSQKTGIPIHHIEYTGKNFPILSGKLSEKVKGRLVTSYMAV